MRTELGSAKYHAAQLFDTVHLVAYGQNPSSGWRNYFDRSPLAVFPPIHSFVCDPPSGMVLPVLTPFVARTSFFAGEEIANVRVNDSSGSHDVPVAQISPEKLDLHSIIESSAPGVSHVHGTQEDVQKLFMALGAKALSSESAAYYERSLGRWVDPFTLPRTIAECVKWCRITKWDKWCCGHAYRVEVMRVEAVLVVQLESPGTIQQQIEIALRDAAVAGAFAALAAALATGGTAAANAFIATFTAALQAKLASMIAEKILRVDVVFRSAWGPL